MSTPSDSNLLRGGKRINPRPRRAARGTDPEHPPFEEQAKSSVVRAGVITIQLNVEGLTKAKCAITEHLMKKCKTIAILLQETYSLDLSELKIFGYNLAACTNSSTHVITSLVKNSASWTPISSSKTDGEVKWTATEIEGTTVVNVYKPPNTKLQVNSIPAFASPCIYAGDFNSHSTTWGFQSTNPDGETLESWTSAAGLQLLYDPKQPDSFYSGRWKSATNPDLAFANISPSLERLVLNLFPNHNIDHHSSHRLIQLGSYQAKL